MNLWVDDCKPAPKGFAVAKTYKEALNLLRKFKYDELYLDHDLGGKHTGLDLLRQLKKEGICPTIVKCISFNPVGRKAILDELSDERITNDRDN